jgi:hypothetical protein
MFNRVFYSIRKNYANIKNKNMFQLKKEKYIKNNIIKRNLSYYTPPPNNDDPLFIIFAVGLYLIIIKNL